MTQIIHLQVDAAMSDMLAQKAALTHKGIEEIAAELLRDGLERDEDIYFSQLSEKREQEATHTVPHDKAWK